MQETVENLPISQEKKEKKTNLKFDILAIICIIIFTIAICPITLQNDTYYTIKIGELISQQGIDMQDHFSWHEDLPYTYPHWAYDLGIYYIYDGGQQLGEVIQTIDTGNEQINQTLQNTDYGMLAIYISTVILACILTVLMYQVMKKLCKNRLVAFLLTLGAVYLLQDFIAARAQLVSYILFVLTILCIENFLVNKKKRYLIGLIAISIILANVHCAVWPFFFVLFLPYVAEYIIACIADMHILVKAQIIGSRIKIKFFKNEEKQKREETILQNKKQKLEKAKQATEKLRAHPFKIQVTKNKAVKWLILVMIICAFTGLLTPIGDTPYTYLIKTMQGNTMDSISEHLPLTLYDDKLTMLVFVMFLAILIFTDTKIQLSDLFMLGGITYMCFMSRRQVSLLIIICGFILAKLIAKLAEKYDREGTKKMLEAMTTILGKLLTLALVMLISIVVFKPKAGQHFINSSAYPVEAADYILENLDVENMRIYNEYNYGSYLLFRGIPVFVDSRADLYAPEFNGTKKEDGTYEGRDIFSDYINISTIATYYETKFESYDITHVITVKNSKLNMFLSRDDNYKQLYKDDHFVIYERLTANVEE